MRVRNWIPAALFAVVGLGCGEPKSVGPLPAPCSATFAWLDKAKPTPDASGMVELPMVLDHVSADDRVWIGAGPQGRCILTKTKIGHKDNFEARVCCEGDLPKAKGGGGTPAFLSIGDGVLEELYVRDLHPPSWAEVYFDLN